MVAFVMSWSIQKRTGKPDKVLPVVCVDLDKAAQMYAGKTEEMDVIAAKSAIVSYLNEVQCADSEGVEVQANGSRGWSLTINVQCNKINLAL